MDGPFRSGMQWVVVRRSIPIPCFAPTATGFLENTSSMWPIRTGCEKVASAIHAAAHHQIDLGPIAVGDSARFGVRQNSHGACYDDARDARTWRKPAVTCSQRMLLGGTAGPGDAHAASSKITLRRIMQRHCMLTELSITRPILWVFPGSVNGIAYDRLLNVLAASVSGTSRVENVIQQLRQRIFEGHYPAGGVHTRTGDCAPTAPAGRGRGVQTAGACVVSYAPINVGSTVTRLSPKDIRERVELGRS